MAMHDISDPVRRFDALDKATGRQKYVGDLRFPGMIYGRMVRSTVPRGKILAIHLPDLPEGYDFVSYKDIPGENALWMIQKDWKCFAEHDVRYVGETIGLLCGPDREVLSDLLAQVKIDYEEQEPAVTIEDALACKGGPILEKDDIFCELTTNSGEDIDKVFARADEVVTETFRTGFQEHVNLEPQSVIAMQENGRYVIYASSQCPFYIRKSTAGLLGLKPEDIDIRQVMTGGAFGAKEHFPDVLAGPALVACHKLHKPVQIVFDRKEETQFTVKRHPSRTTFKTALDKKGNILGMDIDVCYNAGGYLSCSFVVLQRGVFHATGVYHIPATRIHGRGVATNTFPSDAFRGFGAPQTLYAIEQHMDHLARKFGYDPLEYRQKYIFKKGDVTNTEGHINETVKLPEMIQQVTEASDYWRKVKEYGYGKGRGIAIALYNHGGAFTGNGEQALIKAKCDMHKMADGSVEILCGQTEMGQGFHTAGRKIASKVLGIPIEKIIFNDIDTDRVQDSGPTAASRSTQIAGKLIERGALMIKPRYDKEADFTVHVDYEHPEGYPWDQSKWKGDAYICYGWGAAVVEVAVDPLTYEVVTKGIWTSHDAGHPIDLRILHGQVNGGVLQSLGYAAMEVMENRGGKFRQKSLADYIIPCSTDFPKQEVFFVDNPYPYGPFGAKGAGELVFNGADAAYSSAVSMAIGKPVYEIPIPPETIEGIING